MVNRKPGKAPRGTSLALAGCLGLVAFVVVWEAAKGLLRAVLDEVDALELADLDDFEAEFLPK